MALVPANAGVGATSPGLQMRRCRMVADWVPEYDTLPAELKTAAPLVAQPCETELPAGTITEFRGYLNVPQDGHHWHLYLTLDRVPGSKAFVKLHNFHLIDADCNYEPGTTATESAASNTVERDAAKTGKKGIPLKAGLHEITITVVQGATAPGKIRLEWNRGPQGATPTPRVPIPAEAFVH